jgi:DNA-binding HxlR family transcriptional regulator
MSARTYGQYCGLAHALEVVGERWALLVIRDLIPGPKRFTDLQRGLPKIPSNVLSARLKDLEQANVVERRLLPRPRGSVVYELTSYGRELEPIVLGLVLWGMRSLGEPRPGDTVNASGFLVGLQAAFRPEAARGLQATFELHLDDLVVHARIDNGELTLGEGAPSDSDLAIETDTRLRDLMTGELSPADAVESGAVKLTGDPDLLTRFADAFRLPAAELATT